MSESDEIKAAVLESLREHPNLNTPALIVDHGYAPDGAGQDEVKRALDELVAEGRVKHRPTGWKLVADAG